MKKFLTLISISFTVLLGAITSCDDLLEENTFTTLKPSDFFKTGEDAEIVLHSVYGELRYSDIKRDAVTLGEVCTDIALERSGGIFRFNEPIEEFVWATTHGWLQNDWERRYRGISKANVVIDNVPAISMDETRKNEILAEAVFLRALNYYLLFDKFGPVPLITSSQTSAADRPVRATEQEMINFMVTEFEKAAAALPVDDPLGQYGRPTKGAALTALTKLYMMIKDWDQAASTATQVMNLGAYDLFIEGDRSELFSPENQRDNEFIFASVMSDNPSTTTGDGWLSHVVPRGYQWEYPPRQIFAAEYKIRTEFLELFEPEDERLNAFLFEFVNADGETIILGQDNARTLKFPEYPNHGASRSADDYIFFRYADVLLSRAEALNELNNLNQESVDLLNMVRDAAGVTLLTINDFSSAQEFKDFILDERGREFHTEALRRQDLIRHGKFIQMAIERGKPAKDFQVRYPIPQTEIERNPMLVQNDGY